MDGVFKHISLRIMYILSTNMYQAPIDNLRR